tara:strand:- start:605 stop:1108 length:504 start_codon:yes stop_codon:yes gene_type:complete
MSETQKKVFRFKFSNELLELMKEFSQVHQHDTKDNFSDNWSLFLDKNKDFIEIEERRLVENGFVGSINDKMYKSVKYYYTKKGCLGEGGEGGVKKKVERKKYVSVGYDVLVMMNTHIGENIKKEDYKPDKGFNEFIMNIDNIDKDSNEYKRYKKAYKNMYYRFNVTS